MKSEDQSKGIPETLFNYAYWSSLLVIELKRLRTNPVPVIVLGCLDTLCNVIRDCKKLEADMIFFLL